MTGGGPADLGGRFLELHQPGAPLLLPNPWDAGSAKLFASLGFQALATTSSGFAATLGRFDGAVARDEAVEHARAISAATDLPVNVLIFPDGPTVKEFASVGVARVSVGGTFNPVSFGAVAEAARAFLEQGTCGFWETAMAGRKARDAALG